jgi:hypothetical protein
MGIHDLPKKLRESAHGDVGLLACIDELEAHLKDAVLCHISTGHEICFAMIVSDVAFHGTMGKPRYCALATNSGDTRRAVLAFD